MMKALALVAEDMGRVEAAFRANLNSSIDLVRDVGDYILASGGKRVRPLLLLLCARLTGYAGDQHIPLGVVVEYIHTASLLHDDVVDGAHLRRGRPAANAVWGNEEAVLCGDFLYAEAYRLMVRVGNLQVLDLLAEATGLMAEGELLQLRNTCDLDLTEERYLEVVRGKTAVLIAGCCQAAGLLAGVDAAQEAALREFGLLVGTAFQLLDDALDYVAVDAGFGKTRGQDLREGKMTLPLIVTLANCTAAERAEVARILQADALPATDLEQICALIDRYDGVGITRTRAAQMVAQAKEQLQVFADGVARQALCELADYVVVRGK